MQKTINLYSKRFTPARGWHWKLERECLSDTAEEWKKVFQKDEPDAEFVLATKLPKV